MRYDARNADEMAQALFTYLALQRDPDQQPVDWTTLDGPFLTGFVWHTPREKPTQEDLERLRAMLRSFFRKK